MQTAVWSDWDMAGISVQSNQVVPDRQRPSSTILTADAGSVYHNDKRPFSPVDDSISIRSSAPCFRHRRVHSRSTSGIASASSGTPIWLCCGAQHNQFVGQRIGELNTRDSAGLICVAPDVAISA